MKKLLVVLSLVFSACGVAVTPPTDEDRSDVSSPEAASDGAPATDHQTLPDAGPTDAPADHAPTPDGEVADDGLEQDVACRGCYAGASCVTETSVLQCGWNSACVRCPAPTDPCQVPSCRAGRCAIDNVPDGTLCPTGVCQAGACIPCGHAGQPCCGDNPINACAGFTVCRADAFGRRACSPCGSVAEPCCVGGTCGAGAVCGAGGLCDSCGNNGAACCPGRTCGPDLDCVGPGAGTCSCGRAGEPCCARRGCMTGLACDAGTNRCF